TIVVKIAIIAGLAMPASLGTAFAGTSDDPAPSNTKDQPLTVRPHATLHDSDCEAVWSLAVLDEDRLCYERAASYVTDLKAADPDNDGYFDKTEFMDACQKGLVHSAAQDTAIPKSSHVMLRKR